MDLQRLDNIIKKQGRTYTECGKAIGKTVATFGKKMGGQVPIFLNEAEDLGNFLGMSDSEKIEVFLKQAESEVTA